MGLRLPIKGSQNFNAMSWVDEGMVGYVPKTRTSNGSIRKILFLEDRRLGKISMVYLNH